MHSHVSRLASPLPPAHSAGAGPIHYQYNAATLNQARAYSRLVTGSQIAGDELVERALQYVVAPMSDANEGPSTFLALLQAMRMLVRVQHPTSPTALQTRALQSHLQLPIDVREAAALHLALGLAPSEIAELLDRSAAEIEALLAQSWGTYMSLLACCKRT